MAAQREREWVADDYFADEYEQRPPEVTALLGGVKRHPKKDTVNTEQHSATAGDGAEAPDGDPENPDNPEAFNDGSGKAKLTTMEKLAYGLPHLATSAMFIPTSIHINKFFADSLLVPPGTLALATAVARAFDTMLDPFFGWLSDNTNTQWGRRKPYIFVGAPLSAFFYFMLFTPPTSLSPFEASIWFGLFFALYLSIPVTLPHHALAPELTMDYKERSALYAYGEVFSLIGVIAAAAAPGVMAQYMSDTRTIFFFMSAFIAVLLLATFAFLLWIIKEPEQVVHDGNPLVPGLRRAWRNHPFRVLVTTSVLGSIAHHCIALMFPFWVSYVLHPENDALWLSGCLLMYFGSSAISIPAWCYAAQRWDKKNVWLAGWCAQLPASMAMFFLEEGSTYSLLGLTALLGLSFGGSSYLYKAIQADAIDYDELRTTRRREGQYITFWALVPKLVAIPAASIPLIVLEQSGYVPNLHPQTHEVQLTIRIMTTVLPCVLSAMALFVASAYPINRRINAQILRMIARRRRAIRNGTPMPPEQDPVTLGELPQTTGGLTLLTSEFCWYLDYFSEEELRLVLRRGQRALIWSVTWSIYLYSALIVFASVLIWLGTTAVKVMGVMLMSFCGAIIIFHALRLRAAYAFDKEKITIFRKGQEEYFRVMTSNNDARAA